MKEKPEDRTIIAGGGGSFPGPDAGGSIPRRARRHFGGWNEPAGIGHPQIQAVFIKVGAIGDFGAGFITDAVLDRVFNKGL